jgi:hypothetical protein
MSNVVKVESLVFPTASMSKVVFHQDLENQERIALLEIVAFEIHRYYRRLTGYRAQKVKPRRSAGNKVLEVGTLDL